MKLYKLIFSTIRVFGADDFQQWVKKFEIRAINSGISKSVVTEIMSDAKFLPT